MPISFNGRTYFSRAELECKGSKKLILADGFPEALLALRLVWARPIKVTSVCRSTAHNRAVGGSPNSFHICDTGRGCCAADILMPDLEDRASFTSLALSLDWTVAHHRSFIHIDRRADHGAKRIMFLY